MNYDKIKQILLRDNPTIWEFWTIEIPRLMTSSQAMEKYKEARLELKRELEMKILTEQKHFAEYELLCTLSGIKEPLDFSNYYKYLNEENKKYKAFETRDGFQLISYIGTNLYRLNEVVKERGLELEEVDERDYLRISINLRPEQILE